MNNLWFECKVKYEKTLENGAVKQVNEPYLVEAINFSEAERRFIEEIMPYMTGIYEVSDIKCARYADIIESSEERADRFFRAKLVFIVLDEMPGKVKKTTQNILVQAADLPDALQKLEAAMKGTAMDYSIASLAETLIMDIFHYKPAEN